jgi:glycosyltransferase involved in cell wall biosynthesis
MSAPLVSFVIPSYNYGSYLRSCIDSILNQEGSFDFEIVIVDDASTDDSATIIRAYAQNEPRIRGFYHSKNQGHVVTINEGFAAASGKFIARIDSDDFYKPQFLKETLPIFERYSDVGLVYADIEMINENDHSLGFPACPHQGVAFKGNDFAALLENNFIPAPTVIARAEVWRQALPIPAGLGFSDWYLSIRMARHNDFYYLPKPLANYRLHPKNLHSLMILDRSEEETILRLLADVFAQEKSEELLKIKKRVYGVNYFHLADKYFGCQMTDDARRCYLKAASFMPRLLLNPSWVRRSLGAIVGPRPYARLKSLFKAR